MAISITPEVVGRSKSCCRPSAATTARSPSPRVWASRSVCAHVGASVQSLVVYNIYIYCGKRYSYSIHFYIYIYILHYAVHLFDQITVYIFCYALYVLYDV